MRTRGVDFGTLSDEEYEHVVEVDDAVVIPLAKITGDIEEVRFYVEDTTLDNTTQREYVRSLVDNLVFELKQILDNLED